MLKLQALFSFVVETVDRTKVSIREKHLIFCTLIWGAVLKYLSCILYILTAMTDKYTYPHIYSCKNKLTDLLQHHPWCHKLHAMNCWFSTAFLPCLYEIVDVPWLQTMWHFWKIVLCALRIRSCQSTSAACLHLPPVTTSLYFPAFWLFSFIRSVCGWPGGQIAESALLSEKSQEQFLSHIQFLVQRNAAPRWFPVQLFWCTDTKEIFILLYSELYQDYIGYKHCTKD